MTRPGIEPWSLGPLANALLKPVTLFNCILDESFMYFSNSMPLHINKWSIVLLICNVGLQLKNVFEEVFIS